MGNIHTYMIRVSIKDKTPDYRIMKYIQYLLTNFILHLLLKEFKEELVLTSFVS